MGALNGFFASEFNLLGSVTAEPGDQD